MGGSGSDLQILLKFEGFEIMFFNMFYHMQKRLNLSNSYKIIELHEMRGQRRCSMGELKNSPRTGALKSGH